MTSPGHDIVNHRRALEALRNGVPNRDAVRVLGCGQHDVEQRFREQCSVVGDELLQGRQVPGLLLAGGFGTGKSHLLEFLEHLALAANFVCSRVVISKETPLYDPAKVYRAAIETAVVPGLSGPAISEIADSLRKESPAYVEFKEWASGSNSGVDALFPATLLLHERLNDDPELVDEITGFWSGDKLPISRVRQGLRQIGASAAFAVKAISARQLALQRIRFAARLMRGAGYKGWILLIDEVELIGRYSLEQRGRSYAELARWMGKIEDAQYPGLTTIAAITDDFELNVLREKGDRDYIGPKLRNKGTDEYNLLAARAEAGMRMIERESISLQRPDESTLRQTYEHLKDIHARAYEWQPNDIPSTERSSTRAMRSYVRRWINEWDLKRLFPEADVAIVEEYLRPTHGEDQDLEQPAEMAEPSDATAG